VQVSNIIPNQTISVSNTQQHLFEEQLAIIDKRKGVALFNQDDKVDHLRSQSPKGQGQHQRVHSTIDKQNSFLSDFQEVKRRSNAEYKDRSSKLQDQTMISNIQQLIAQQIEQGVSKLELQNKSSLEKQSYELTQLLMQ
jgi:uncharacterized membrane protein YccC